MNITYYLETFNILLMCKFINCSPQICKHYAIKIYGGVDVQIHFS
jgi:hypothetical protein